MANITVLNSETHRDLRVKTDPSAKYGDAVRFVSVVVSEFGFLTLHYPLFFSKDANTGTFYCGAMLGFDDGENLFLGKEAVADAYRPLNLQRGPFYAAGTELAVDLDHPRLTKSGGQGLFNESGAPTSYLENIMATMRELTAGAAATNAFIDVLMAAKLIEPIELDIAFDDGTRRDVVGLYTISQDTLAALPDEMIVELFRRGYLKLIYLMIASLKQVNVLAQRKNRALLDAR